MRYRKEITDSLVLELEQRKDYLEGKTVETIYFGGGSPSMLNASEISEILNAVSRLFRVSADAEITLEANPDDLSAEKLGDLQLAGINRLSIGVQSFNDEDLTFLNRVHSADDAYNCITRAQEAGFTNLSIDLIYGIPTLSAQKWESNLQKVLELNVPHISAYALTVEEKTPLAVLIKRGKVANVDDSIQHEHFSMLVNTLQEHGYLHYEISNFCKPGMFSRHNTSYWKEESYLGIGPSAHSFNRESRQWNGSNLGEYIRAVKDGNLAFEKEILTKDQKFNEYIMTSLRTMWGCNLEHIRGIFGSSFAEKMLEEAAPMFRQGLLREERETLYLTAAGKFRADGIAASLFRV